jgi:hypothetical protein
MSDSQAPSAAQHMVMSGIVLAVAVIVTWLSYTQTPVEAFLFPRLISVFFQGLAVWTFARAVLRLSRVGDGIGFGEISNLAPGLAILLVYVFWMAKAIGFYAASTLAFFLIFTIYDPSSHGAPRAWLKRILVTAAFMAVIYCLFTLVLKVQTPRGILI